MTPTTSSSKPVLSKLAIDTMFMTLVVIITFATSTLPACAEDKLWVIRPNTSAAWAIGSTQPIIWDVAPGQRADKKWWNKAAHVELLDVNKKVVMNIGTRSMNNWSFDWTIPNHLQPGHYAIRVSVPSVQLEADSASFKVFQPKVVELQPTVSKLQPKQAPSTPIQPIAKPVTQIKNLSFVIKNVTYTLQYNTLKEVQIVIEANSNSGFQFGDLMSLDYGFGNVQPLATLRIDKPLRVFKCPPVGPVQVDYDYLYHESFALPNPTWHPIHQNIIYNSTSGTSNNWQYPTAPLPAGKVTFGLILKPVKLIGLMAIRTRQPMKNRDDGCYYTFNPRLQVWIDFVWKTPKSGTTWNPNTDYDFDQGGSAVDVSVPYVWFDRLDNCFMSLCFTDLLGP
jgi:hypothetical protein